MGPSCGSGLENRWFLLPTSPSPPLKDAGTQNPVTGGATYLPGTHLSCPLIRLRRSMNEIKNLHYLPRASEPREVLFEDRTKAHADHVGQTFDWQSTAAVGVLKAVHFGEW